MTRMDRDDGKRRQGYDLPLTRGSGAHFLTLLIGLMTFLAVMALAGFFALSAMNSRWSSGLQNRATVEIPAQDADGKTLDAAEIRSATGKVADLLRRRQDIGYVHMLSDAEIQNLVKPWLGGHLLADDVPLPGLVSLAVDTQDTNALIALGAAITNVAPGARLDTHQEWMRDLLRFTGALQFAAILLTAVIGLTATTAVAGAVRARLAVHRADVELLHLMGAADSYIARQFQRHAARLALRGSLAGLVAGIVVLAVLAQIAGPLDINLLPDFRLRATHLAALAVLPLIATVLAIAVACNTVMATLGRMP